MEPEPLTGDKFIEDKDADSFLHVERLPGIPTYHPTRGGGSHDSPTILVRSDVIQELDENAG